MFATKIAEGYSVTKYLKAPKSDLHQKHTIYMKLNFKNFQMFSMKFGTKLFGFRRPSF